MSHPNARFGERYFATRKRLSEVVVGVRELAGEVGCELNGFGDDSELLRGLRNPFLFVVCGEVNAGKSTFINGLFGQELCEANVLPQTDRVMWYRYGEQEHDEAVTEALEECYRPIDFLNDFNIVDTPGTNSVVKGHEVITKRFLPVADLLLFVFPVGNPWGAATWDFIEGFPDELRGRVAFVLAQKDQRDERELEVITEHIRDIAQKKLGEEPELFVVSGLEALEAKRREPFEDRAWRQSGYPQLEDYISKVVTDSPARRRVLLDVRDATSKALRTIEDEMDSQAGRVKRRDAVVRQLEAEAGKRRDNYGDLFEAKLEGLGEVFADEADKAVDLLRRRLKIIPTVLSLFRRDEFSHKLEKVLVEAVGSAVEELADVEGEDVERVCREHWENATPRIREEIGGTVPDIDDEAVDFEMARSRFTKRMGRGARQAALRLKLRGMLEIQLEGRRAALRRWLVGVLAFVAAGGILGALSVHPWSWVALGAGGAAALAGCVECFRSGRDLLTWFRNRISSNRMTFARELVKDYVDGLKEFFGRYSKLFDEIREDIFATETELKPRLKRWNELFLEIKALEREL